MAGEILHPQPNCAFLVSSFGVWKIRAKFESNPQEIFSAEFEVKEYGESQLSRLSVSAETKETSYRTRNDFFPFSVLPSFEVKLTPGSSFFYVDSPSLTIDIKARYVKPFQTDDTTDTLACGRMSLFGQAFVVVSIAKPLLPR